MTNNKVILSLLLFPLASAATYNRQLTSFVALPKRLLIRSTTTTTTTSSRYVYRRNLLSKAYHHSHNIKCTAEFSPSPSPPQNQKTISWQELSIQNQDHSSANTLSSAEENESVGDRIKQGESVVLLSNVLSPEECQSLVESALQAGSNTEATEIEQKTPGLLRLPTRAAAARAAQTKTPCAKPLPDELDEQLQQILLRVTSYIDQELPSVASVLFDTQQLHPLMQQSDDCLHFSSREPAINIYQPPGGEFLAHKDAQALTVLLPLSCPDQDFNGGGTAFWSQDARGHRVEAPTIIVKPPAGTALLFGGMVTHSGLPVTDGTRVVFVASFSSSPCRSTNATNNNIQQHRDIYGDAI